MIKPIACSLLAAAAVLGAVGSATGSPAPAVLTVDLDQPGKKVSPLLYGAFFEEINHAGDGGLYAELVRNRSFEDGPTPEGWSLVREAGGQGQISLDRARPLNAAQRQSLRLEIGAGGGRVGAANGGYWGIAVQPGKEYRLSLWARSAGSGGPLTASLESAAGTVYASGKITGIGPEWSRHELRLRSSGNDPAARLVLSGSTPGTVWLDMVSLFPKDTWKGRPNGLRADLARMVQEMKPRFVRFPGGCFVEGDVLENAFRWKTTVGPIEERPGHSNAKWGYRSTDGLGYHEYLQFCEDLGAEPLYVINCGMACSFSSNECVPVEELGPWVQDALDAIEYANGPVTSKWGAQRARNGHPEPFRLKYLQIGNENGWGNTLPLYEERYRRFAEAVKQRYPEVRLISCVPLRTQRVEMVDDHYYNTPEWFLNNAHLYDRYDRSRPKVYVGEYAVTQKCGQGNLRAAVAEAAFMLGLERNADIIEMASYAPLFVNVRDRKWNPDAICFDSASAYGTPSYHVQKLFADNWPEEVLPTRLELPPSPVLAAAQRGAIGLGTWSTQAEFDDVRVSQGGRTLYATSFQAPAAEWKSVRGNWQVRDGVLRQVETSTDRQVVAGDPAWGDYTLHLRARKLGGAEGFLIKFRARDDRNFYWWNLGGWNNERHAIEKSEDGSKTALAEVSPGRIETGRWYDIRIELQGPRIRCFLDGKLVHDVVDQGASPLHASAGRRGDDVLVKVVNAGAEPQDVELRLPGGAVRSEVTVTVLTGSDPEDENSFSQPRRIAPVARRVSGGSGSLRHSFPPHSVTVLKLQAR